MNPRSKFSHGEIHGRGFSDLEPAAGNLGKVRDFYSGLLTWDFRELLPEDPVVDALFHTSAVQRGGKVPQPAPRGAGSRPRCFQVNDLDAVVARAWELGGEIVVPPTVRPGAPGSFCIIRDPCGAAIGLWQAAAAESSAV